MPPESVRLTEWTTSTVACDLATVRLLQDRFRAQVSPAREQVPGALPRWDVRAGGVVGVVRTDQGTVVVRPRIPVANVLYLAGAGEHRWGESVGLAMQDELHTALARLFVLVTQRTLADGVLRGYREKQDDLPTVRGRIDIAEQVRRRPGVALPLAVRYQEHDEDVVENRTLKAAATALHRLGIDDPEVRRGLRRIQLTLADVAPLDAPGASNRVVWSRLNERYRPAVALAQLVLDGSGIDLSAGSTSALSLTLSMPAVFEGFLERVLGPRLRSRGGTVTAQATAWSLDVAGKVPLRPDLVWHDADVPRAVVDAKYQSTGPQATHGDNVYQLLAYCTALGLSEGHLVYAHSVGETPSPVQVVHDGPVIHTHALDLGTTPSEILRQVDHVAESIAGRASRAARPA